LSAKVLSRFHAVTGRLKTAGVCGGGRNSELDHPPSCRRWTACRALGSGKLTERAGRWLKFLSGLAMLTLRAVPLLRPHRLT
jgi:hypothetical protein